MKTERNQWLKVVGQLVQGHVFEIQDSENGLFVKETSSISANVCFSWLHVGF